MGLLERSCSSDARVSRSRCALSRPRTEAVAAHRAATVRATRDRDSILGRYSLDEHGHTTCTDYGRYAVADGELVWDRSGAPGT